jgi:hypothetical protein
MRWNGFLSRALLASILAAWCAPATAGPITFNTALPVHVGEWIVRQETIWMKATDDPSPMDRNLNALVAPTVVVYGLNRRVALFAIEPFLSKQIEVSTPRGRITRGTTGFGDLTAMARVTAVAIDRSGETIRLAPFAGLKLPTGRDDEADGFGRLPQPLQLGSGSWDPLVGTVFTWQTLRWELDASVSYQRRTEANAFRAGDEGRGEASFQYRLVPAGNLGEGVPSYLLAVFESTAVWRGRDRLAGVRDHDSGGFTWYVAPGLQWVTQRTVLEAAVQIPVVKITNGLGLREDFTGQLSLRVSF